MDIDSASTRALSKALDSLDAIDSRTVPFGEILSHVDLPAYSCSIADILDYCTGQSIWINFHRQRVVLSQSRVAECIDSLVDGRCREIVNDETRSVSSRDWLTKLTKTVQSTLACGDAVVLKSADFIKGVVPKASVYTEEARAPGTVGRRRRLARYQIPDETVEVVRRALHHWMGSSSSFVVQARVQLTNILLRYLGAGSLLVPSIWNLYIGLPPWLFTEDCPRVSDAEASSYAVFNPAYFDDLCRDLDALTREDPSLVEQLDALQDAYMQRYKDTCEHVHGVIASETKQASLRKVLVQASRKAKLVPTVPLPPDMPATEMLVPGSTVEGAVPSRIDAAPVLSPQADHVSNGVTPAVSPVCGLYIHANVLSH